MNVGYNRSVGYAINENGAQPRADTMLAALAISTPALIPALSRPISAAPVHVTHPKLIFLPAMRFVPRMCDAEAAPTPGPTTTAS